jgi:hypothetical protein
MGEAAGVAANTGPRIRGLWPGGGFVVLHLFSIASVVAPEVVRRNGQGADGADGAALLAGLLAFLVVLTAVVILQRNESARRVMGLPYSELFVARDAMIIAYSLQVTPFANFAVPQLEDAGTKGAVLGFLGLFFVSFVWGRLLRPGRSIPFGAIAVLGAISGTLLCFQAGAPLSDAGFPVLVKFANYASGLGILATFAASGAAGVTKILDDEMKARGLVKAALGLLGAAFLFRAVGYLACGIENFPEDVQRPADLQPFIGAGGVSSAIFFFVAVVEMFRTISRPTASAVVGGVFALLAALGVGVSFGAKPQHALVDETRRAEIARRDSEERRAVAEHAEEDARRRIAEADADRQRQAAAALADYQNSAALAQAAQNAGPRGGDGRPVTTTSRRHSAGGDSHHRSRRGGGGSGEPDLGDLGL